MPSSETRAHRTSSEHRKVGAREARREAARRIGGKPRERCKAGSRDGSEPRKGSVTGVGRRIRPAMFRGVSRRLPWSRRGRCGWRLSDTIPASVQRLTADAAPRSTGGFGRTVTRGCVASGGRFDSRLAPTRRPAGLCVFPIHTLMKGKRLRVAHHTPVAGNQRGSRDDPPFSAVRARGWPGARRWRSGG